MNFGIQGNQKLRKWGISEGGLVMQGLKAPVSHFIIRQD